jgi:hypothetical protein
MGRIVMIGVVAATLAACEMQTRAVVAGDSLMTAARQACSSYGIQPYTEKYERCVRNEYAYRSQG